MNHGHVLELGNETMAHRMSCYFLIKAYDKKHYSDVIMRAMASQITSLTIVYSNIYSDADQRKHQNYASLTFVMGIHRWPVNSPHKGPVTWKMFPFDEVIMSYCRLTITQLENPVPRKFNTAHKDWLDAQCTQLSQNCCGIAVILKNKQLVA